MHGEGNDQIEHAVQLLIVIVKEIIVGLDFLVVNMGFADLPVEFIILTELKGNNVHTTEGCIDRALVNNVDSFPVWHSSEDREDIVVGGDNTRYVLRHILRMQVFEVDLHRTLDIKQTLVVVRHELHRIKLVDEEEGAVQDIGILESPVGQVIVGWNIT